MIAGLGDLDQRLGEKVRHVLVGELAATFLDHVPRQRAIDRAGAEVGPSAVLELVQLGGERLGEAGGTRSRRSIDGDLIDEGRHSAPGSRYECKRS